MRSRSDATTHIPRIWIQLAFGPQTTRTDRESVLTLLEMGKPPFEMGGRPADENLPEAVQHPQPQPPMASATPLPEVVPDSSPEFAQPRHYMETDKYPVYYDAAPKFPHEPQTPGMQGMPSPGHQSHQSHQPWTDAEHSVSMMSPDSSLPWQSFPPGDDQQTYVGSEPPAPEKRICGLRKRLFIIIAVIVALVVVGAAVGGGVGGSIAARQGSSDGAGPAETSSASSSRSVFQHGSPCPGAIDPS